MSQLRTSALSKERPFPGLRPFYSQDHDFFFGRDDQIFALYRLIDRNRDNFVAVVGNSGSGKSSLVRAGLQPLLEEESMNAGGRTWLQTDMTPGRQPLARLTDALASLVKGDDEGLASARRERISFCLRNSSYGIEDALTDIRMPEKAAILLIIDQFEELFRYAAVDPGRSVREDAKSRDEALRFVQLLLQASNARTRKVHVLLTMRSDFIGDCARFHGLPEAVSRSQFLVPSLTRDQLEDVIREPIAAANATIEPELVNTLLNEGNDEPDQLPVLQHCLLRLWERAGSTNAAAAAATGAERRLTLTHYGQIGGISGALSNHADDILRDLIEDGTPEAAVERVFRALSEVDKNGRAIRRPRRFSQLRDETGVSDGDLQLVINRFCAEDCSFLVEKKSDEQDDDPLVDVGHEALLRRWTRVSGEPDAPAVSDDANSVRKRGWLVAEQRDEMEYRDLRGRIDDFWLPLRKLRKLRKWWSSRTPAWGQRYGGRFAEVDELFRKSLRRWSAAAAATVLILIAGGWVGKQRIDEVRESAHLKHQNEENYKAVLETTTLALKAIYTSLRDGAMPLRTGRKLLDALETNVNKAKVLTEKPELDAVAAEYALVVYDVEYSLGNQKAALPWGRRANELARKLVALDEKNGSSHPEWRHLLYGSAFRIGDIIVWTDAEEGLKQYREAQQIALRLSSGDPGKTTYKEDIVFSTNKIGEGRQIQGKIPEAIIHFRTAVEFAEDFATAQPRQADLQRLLASSHAKLGSALTGSTPPNFEGALAEYDTATKIQKKLADEQTIDSAFRSNLAITFKMKGDLFLRRSGTDQAISGDLGDAADSYKAAIAIWEPLVKRDLSDMRWRIYIAPAYGGLGDTLLKAGDTAGARVQIQKEVDTWQVLAESDPSNEPRQQQLAAGKNKLERLDRLIAQQPTPPIDPPATGGMGGPYIPVPPGTAPMLPAPTLARPQ